MTGLLPISNNLSISRSELEYRFSRSSGPGGQHVNKVSTRVEILFDVANSKGLSDNIRGRFMRLLRPYLTADGVLVVSAQESRSQWKNRLEAEEKLVCLLRSALVPPKRRIPTKPSSGGKARRLENKRKTSEKKRLRSKSID